jgi:hypothetical protein
MVVVHPLANLREIILTTTPPRGFPRGLNSWQEQRHEDADDRNNDK